MPGAVLPTIAARVRAADRWLLAVGTPVRVVILAATVAAMVYQALPQVPRQFADLSGTPLAHGVEQRSDYGPDTVGDGYEAKVVLNDPLDMYTKAKLEQTPVESSHWTKAESAPYPPAMLLAEAGLYKIGEATGLQFYGVILVLGVIFLALSLVYFVRTRWYVFPLLYGNFAYLGYRFAYVQDCSYIVMLDVVACALLLARARRPLAHALMAVAIAMKVTPLWYAKNVFLLPRRTAVAFGVIVVLGLVAPFAVWKNYAYILTFHESVKGDRLGLVAAIVWAVPFGVALWYVDAKLGFDWEDRVGWSMVPLGMFMAMRMNVPRHLLMALLIPDKRAVRNLVAAAALVAPTLFPHAVSFGSMLPVSTVLLFAVLAGYLRRIGWAVVRDDARHLGRTAMLMLRATDRAAPLTPGN